MKWSPVISAMDRSKYVHHMNPNSLSKLAVYVSVVWFIFILMVNVKTKPEVKNLNKMDEHQTPLKTHGNQASKTSWLTFFVFLGLFAILSFKVFHFYRYIYYIFRKCIESLL